MSNIIDLIENSSDKRTTGKITVSDRVLKEIEDAQNAPGWKVFEIDNYDESSVRPTVKDKKTLVEFFNKVFSRDQLAVLKKYYSFLK